MKSLRGSAVATILGVMLLSACGGTTDANTNDGEPQAGGRMTIVSYSEPTGLDPAVMVNQYSNHGLYGNAIFGTLIKPGEEPGTLSDEGLAESLTTSDGGTTWVLKLRDGLTFSDGTPFDAAAVEFNWSRLPGLKSESSPAALMVSKYAAKGQTLTLTLTAPDAHFPQAVMTTSLNWIASPKALKQGATFSENPVGAGPFVLKDWGRNDQMVLSKNKSYFAEGKPYLDELVIKPIAEEEQRFTTVQSGGAEAAVSATPQHFDRAEGSGLEVYSLPISGGIPQYFNARMAPFDDPRAREAVVRAVDLGPVNEATYETTDYVATSLFNEESPFYNPDIRLTEHDPERAQELFDELAAEGKPVEFTMTSYPSPSGVRAVEAIQAQLNDFENVKVEVEVLDYPAALAKFADRSFQTIAGGPSFQDPDYVLYNELHSESAGNRTGVFDAKLDAALEKGRMSTDLEERKAAYDVVAERFAALNPWLLYTRVPPSVIHSPDAHGFTMFNRGSMPVDGLWVSQ